MSQILSHVDGRTKKRIKPEVYRQNFEKLLGSEYELLTDYFKSSTKVQVRHRTCGRETWVNPLVFIRTGGGCRVCSTQARRTDPSLYREQFNTVHQSRGFTLISEYTSSTQNIIFRHEGCGQEISYPAFRAIKLKKCPHCEFGIHQRETLSLKKQQAFEHPEFKIIKQSTQLDEAIEVTHLTCGKTYKAYSEPFLSRPYCPHCFEVDAKHPYSLNVESLQARLDAHQGPHFIIEGPYLGSLQKITVRHEDCGKLSFPHVTNLLNGRYRCPRCKQVKVNKCQ